MGLHVDLLLNGQVSTFLCLPWRQNPASCLTHQVVPLAVRSPSPSFLKTCCSSSCTRRGGNNNMEALLKHLPRPAYSKYCCPGIGLELGGLDSVPLILTSSRQIHHLHWSKLVAFLLLPLELHQAKWDKDWGSGYGVTLNGKPEDEFSEMLVPSWSLHLVNYALNFKEEQNKITDMKVLSVPLKKHIYGWV